MRLAIKLIPQEIIDKCNLTAFEEGGWVYVKIVRGMYGLPQAGKLANDLLQKHLSKSGYYPFQFTPGLWRHAWRPITFTLVVDNFGIKFTGNTHAHHLIKALKQHYDVIIDRKGELFVGIKLKWDYDKHTLGTHKTGATKINMSHGARI